MHVLIDGYGGDAALMADCHRLERLLDDYPAQIGMTKIAPAVVYRYEGANPQDWGLSGFVVIAESHISVHTFPSRCILWADIFSCKDFDATAAILTFSQAFGLKGSTYQILPRGLHDEVRTGGNNHYL